MSLSRDNTRSWARISHGSNKFVMNLNNETEIPEDQLEEYALKLDAKGFTCRSKTKAKPQRREPAGSSRRIVPVERRNCFPGSISIHSLSVKSIPPTTENWLRKLYEYSMNNNTSTDDKHETNHINNRYNDTNTDTRKLHNL